MLLYVHNGIVREEFIGFAKADELDADSLVVKTCETLNATGIDSIVCWAML